MDPIGAAQQEKKQKQNKQIVYYPSKEFIVVSLSLSSCVCILMFASEVCVPRR